jgi:hypothetical protein
MRVANENFIHKGHKNRERLLPLISCGLPVYYIIMYVSYCNYVCFLYCVKCGVFSKETQHNRVCEEGAQNNTLP